MRRLRLHARAEPPAVETWLLEEDGVLALVEIDGAGERALPLPDVAVVGTFARYGKPLDEALAIPPLSDEDNHVPVAHARGTAILRAFSYRAPVDVLPHDWLLLEVPGEEPLAAPAPLVAAALTALARAASRVGG